jgi:hypothetical protein
MAARLNPRHSDMVRTKIKCSQLINLLQKHALDGEEIADSRRDSAKFLIGMSLAKPATETNLNVDGSITVEVLKFADTTAK